MSSSTKRKPMRSSSPPVRKAKGGSRCPVCGRGVLVPADDIVSELEGYAFVERGGRCAVCGEEFLPEEESERLVRVARRLGIWGEPLKPRRKLSRSGRGTVARIPADIERALGLRGAWGVPAFKAGRQTIIADP